MLEMSYNLYNVLVNTNLALTISFSISGAYDRTSKYFWLTSLFVIVKFVCIIMRHVLDFMLIGNNTSDFAASVTRHTPGILHIPHSVCYRLPSFHSLCCRIVRKQQIIQIYKYV